MINIEKVLAALLFIGYGALIAYLLRSGQYQLFLHSRFTYFLWGSVILFAVFAMMELRKIRQSPDYRVKLEYLAFALPLLISSTALLGTTDLDLVTTRGVQIGEDITVFPQDDRACTDARSVPAIQSQLILDDSDLPRYLDRMYVNPADFVGSSVTMRGFVYRPQSCEQGDFIITRLVMTCCIADAKGYGLMATGVQAHEFVDGEWYIVKGTLSVEERAGDQKPVLIVTTAEKIPEPTDKYVMRTFG